MRAESPSTRSQGYWYLLINSLAIRRARYWSVERPVISSTSKALGCHRQLRHCDTRKRVWTPRAHDSIIRLRATKRQKAIMSQDLTMGRSSLESLIDAPKISGDLVLRKLISNWPLIQQIRTGADGTGPESMSDRTRSLGPKTLGALVARSICPYCAVGCGQLVYHKGGKLVSIEGDPASPISRGHLCPKGADTYELHTHKGRLTEVLYRAPFSRTWQTIPLDRAMDMVADRAWDTRDRTFEETRGGSPLMHTTAMAHLGGATLDNEENYLIKKLFSAGLGMVCVSNQARI